MHLAALVLLSLHLGAPPEPPSTPFPTGVLLRWRAPVEDILWARRPGDKPMGTLTIRRDGRWSVVADDMRERSGQMSRRQVVWLSRNVGKLDYTRQVACADVPPGDGRSPIILRPDPHGPCWSGDPHMIPTELGFVDPLRDTERAPERYFGEVDLDAGLLLSWHDGRSKRRLTVSRDGRLDRVGGGTDSTTQLDATTLADLERLLARTQVKTRRETTARKCLISGVYWSTLVVRTRNRVVGTTWDECLEIPTPGLEALIDRLAKLAPR